MNFPHLLIFEYNYDWIVLLFGHENLLILFEGLTTQPCFKTKRLARVITLITMATKTVWSSAKVQYVRGTISAFYYAPNMALEPP